MTFPQRISLALAAPFTLTLVVGLALLAAQPAPPAPVIATSNLQFDADRARALAAELEALAPVRAVGSPESARVRAWLIEHFNALGLETETLAFPVTVASQRRVGEQVWARLPGASDRALLVSAHYDTPADGARSNAAGVAALLELARIFSGTLPTRTVIFMASDSREYGRSWGMKSWLEQVPGRGQLIAALTLEANMPRAGVQVEDAGLHFGAAPLELRRLAQAAVQQASGQPPTADGIDDFLSRALPFDMSEHGMLLRSGVPAVGLSAAPESVAALGRAAEAWLRALEQQPALPDGAPFDWQLGEALVLTTPTVLGLGLLFFAPLLLATGLAFERANAWRSTAFREAQRPLWQELMPEALALLGAALPLVNGLAVLLILVLIGWLPRYEWFPATPGDPFLRQPADWALVLALVVAAASALEVFGRRSGWGRVADRLAVPTRRLTLLLVLSALALVAWAINPFAAVLWLGPAAYLWPWVEPGLGRALNSLLVLGGFAPLVGLAVGLWLTPAVSVWSWFVLLGAIYGLFPLPVTLAVVLLIAVGVRFLRYGLRATL